MNYFEKMMNYNVEDMLIRNEGTRKVYGQSNANRKGGNFVWNIEDSLTIDEKIKIIDELAPLVDEPQNIATQMVEMFNKLEDDSKNDKIKKDPSTSDRFKSVSLKAWLKRNDINKTVSFRDHDYPKFYYYMFGNAHDFYNKLITGYEKYHYQDSWHGEHIVHQWFHDMLKKLRILENVHFNETDEKSVLMKKVGEMMRRYSWLDDGTETFEGTIFHIGNGHYNDITLEELKIVSKYYNKIEDYINQCSKELQEELNK